MVKFSKILFRQFSPPHRSMLLYWDLVRLFGREIVEIIDICATWWWVVSPFYDFWGILSIAVSMMYELQFLRRDAMLPRYMLSSCVRRSVCLFVRLPESQKLKNGRLACMTPNHSVAISIIEPWKNELILKVAPPTFGRTSSPEAYWVMTLASLDVKPGPHYQQCRSNIVEATGNFVACCFDNVAVLVNNVEATFDFVERTKFQRKTRSTLLPFLATKSNVASTLLLVWTGL